MAPRGIRRAEYGSLLTQGYDLDKPEAPAEELAYYLHHIRQYGEPVLEAMCGSGRFLVPLLAAGIDIDGIDASPHMLASCAAKCSGRGLQASLHEQLLHELDLPRRYRFIFAGGASFGLIFHDREVEESLHRLHTHLLPGGHLLLEVETPRAAPAVTDAAGGARSRKWTRPDGGEIVQHFEGSYDQAAQILRGTLTYELWLSGERVAVEDNAWVLRYWAQGDFTAQLSSAGFEVVRAIDPYKGRSAEGRVISYLAQRPASGSQPDR
jgi:SAM-dependent methyltransferase